MDNQQRFSLRKYKFGLASVLLGVFFVIPDQVTTEVQAKEQQNGTYEVHHEDFDKLTPAQQARIIPEHVNTSQLIQGVYTLVYQDDAGQVYGNTALPATGQQTEAFYKLLLSGVAMATGFIILRKSRKSQHLLLATLTIAGVTYSATVAAKNALSLTEFVIASEVKAKDFEGYRYVGYFVDEVQAITEVEFTPVSGASNTPASTVTEVVGPNSSVTRPDSTQLSSSQSGTTQPSGSVTETVSQPIQPTSAPAPSEPISSSEMILQPVIQLDPIAGDGVLSMEEATQEIEITGTVSGVDDATSVNVTISVNGKYYEATLSPDHRFTATVPGKQLVNAKGVVSAVVTATNDKGKNFVNTTQQEVAIEHATIEIDPITGDDIIQATEAQQTSIPISGKINVVDGVQSGGLTVSVGDFTATIAIGTDGVL